MGDATARTTQPASTDTSGANVREVIAALFIALDGVASSPEKWQFDHFDDDMMAAMSREIADLDTVLMGRVTYEEWRTYWPTSTDEPYASHINNTPKIVFSNTLDHVDWGQWGKIRLARSTAEEIARLKQQPGRTIGVAGSISLVRSLLRDGLLDQLTLLIHPVVAGRGKRLFPGDSDVQRMELVDSQVSRTGVAMLTYRPRRGA